MTEKRCVQCGITKLVADFAKRTASKDGLQAYCRPCCAKKSKEGREHRRLNPVPRTIPEAKRCNICGEMKPASAFYPNQRCRDGLSIYCKCCELAKVRDNCRRRATSDPVLPTDGKKTCARCKRRKSLDQFNTNRAYSDHRNGYCRSCYRRVQRKRFIQRHGLTEEQYDAMHQAQGERCAICRKRETHTRYGEVLMLCVDHNHTTGTVRELLCSRCNRAIGLLGEDTQVLEQALHYLRKHSR